MWPLRSRIPERLPADLRRTLLEFLGAHPRIRLARTTQHLFHRTPKLCGFRRRRRWTRHLEWAGSSLLRRSWLIVLAEGSRGLHRDPRGPHRGDFYDMNTGRWASFDDADAWAATLGVWRQWANNQELRVMGLI